MIAYAIWRLTKASFALQEFDMTIVYKYGCKHSDADCLFSVDSTPVSSDDEEDEDFLGAVKVADMARVERNDCGLHAVMEYLEGQGRAVPRVFFPLLFFQLRR